jgi:hypothetical protein
MRRFLIATLIMIVPLTGAFAGTRCRDSSGKFMKCPPGMSKVVHCRDAAGKFEKCSMPGAKPA